MKDWVKITRPKDYTIEKNYCDMCNVFIDEYEEYEDGYIPSSKGDIKIEFYHEVCGRMIFEGCLCEECKEIKAKQIASALNSVGFEIKNKDLLYNQV